MDKYGAITDNNPITSIKIKTSETTTCPICGKLLEDLNIKKCAEHGIKPFQSHE